MYAFLQEVTLWLQLRVSVVACGYRFVVLVEMAYIQVDHPLTKRGALLTTAHSSKEPKVACVIYAHLKPI